MQKYMITSARTDIDLNKEYFLEEAIEIVKQIRKSGNNAELYPKEYFQAKIDKFSAWNIAKIEYDKIKNKNPKNYGELREGFHNPIYYNFYCRDYEKEAQGMSPGRYAIRIDKIKGSLLSKEEALVYHKLNYSF